MHSRLKTIGKNSHTLGRIALSFSLDLKRQSLFVRVDKARDLPPSFSESAVFVRVQIHKKKESNTVVDNLFASRLEMRATPTAWRTELHFSTLYPYFQQETEFQLRDLWQQLDSHRLFIAVMATEASRDMPHDVLFVGSLSFAFDELPGLQAVRWFWLESKARGLSTHEAVAHEEFAVDPAKNVRVVGRKKGLSNEFINGVYVLQDSTEGGRPLYQAAERSGLWLYYHSTRGAWAVGETPGSSAPYAFAVDRAGTPDNILEPWQVFSAERAFVAPGSQKAPPPGQFEPDLNVMVISVGRPQTSPQRPAATPRGYATSTSMSTFPAAARTGASSMRLPATPSPALSASSASASQTSALEVAEEAPRTSRPALRRTSSVKVTREMKLNDLVESMGTYLKQLRVIDGYFNELQTSLTEDEHAQLFSNFPVVLSTAATWTKQLRAHQARDPDFTQPIGELLSSGANLLAEPLVKFCSATQHHGDLITQMAESSPAFADDIHEVQELMQTDLTLATALTLPLEQAVSLQQILAFVANSTPVFHSDRDLVLQARNTFDTICSRVLGRQPRPAFVISPPSHVRRRSMRTGVRHSAVFDEQTASLVASALGEQSSLSSQATSALSPGSVGPTSSASIATTSQPKPVSASASSSLSSSQRSTVSAAWPVSRQESIAEEDGEPQAGTTPTWLHKAMPKSQAEAYLSNLVDGSFLVHDRQGFPGQYVLALVYRGRPSFHLLSQQDGCFLVNHRNLGPAPTLASMIELLKRPIQGWPQVLLAPVPAS